MSVSYRGLSLVEFFLSAWYTDSIETLRFTNSSVPFFSRSCDFELREVKILHLVLLFFRFLLKLLLRLNLQCDILLRGEYLIGKKIVGLKTGRSKFQSVEILVIRQLNQQKTKDLNFLLGRNFSQTPKIQSIQTDFIFTDKVMDYFCLRTYCAFALNVQKAWEE